MTRDFAVHTTLSRDDVLVLAMALQYLHAPAPVPSDAYPVVTALRAKFDGIIKRAESAAAEADAKEAAVAAAEATPPAES